MCYIGESRALDILTTIGCSISTIAISVTLITLVVLWRNRQRNIPKRTIFVMLNLSVALLLLNISLLLSQSQSISSNPISCKNIAVVLHFALLGALVWMFNEAVYIFIGIYKVGYKRSFNYFHC